MNITEIKDILYIVLAVSGAAGSFIGGVWWLAGATRWIEISRSLK